MRHGLTVITAAVFLMLGTSLRAQDLAATCRDAVRNPVPACTQAIESGTLSGQKLADAYIERGSAYARAKLFSEALADFEQAAKAAPRHERVWAMRGMVYDMQRQDLASAVENINRALALSPGIVYPLRQLGFAYVGLKKYDAALTAWDRLLKALPNEAPPLNDLCWTRALANKMLEVALKECNEALQLTPDSAATINSRAFVYYRMGEMDKALADYTASLAVNPEMAGSLYMRGVIHAMQGRSQEGARDIAAAKAIEAGVAERYAGYGVVP